MQYKNDNTAFLWRSVVSGLMLEFDITAVLNCEKLIDNFVCLNARKHFVIDCELLDMLVANIWYQLMQIIIYTHSSSWM